MGSIIKAGVCKFHVCLHPVSHRWSVLVGWLVGFNCMPLTAPCHEFLRFGVWKNLASHLQPWSYSNSKWIFSNSKWIFLSGTVHSHMAKSRVHLWKDCWGQRKKRVSSTYHSSQNLCRGRVRAQPWPHLRWEAERSAQHPVSRRGLEPSRCPPCSIFSTTPQDTLQEELTESGSFIAVKLTYAVMKD